MRISITEDISTGKSKLHFELVRTQRCGLSFLSCAEESPPYVSSFLSKLLTKPPTSVSLNQFKVLLPSSRQSPRWLGYRVVKIARIRQLFHPVDEFKCRRLHRITYTLSVRPATKRPNSAETLPTSKGFSDGHRRDSVLVALPTSTSRA